MKTDKNPKLNDEFAGLYDTLASFFGGDELGFVLWNRYGIFWNHNGINYNEKLMARAVRWMSKKCNEISKPDWQYTI